MGLDPLQLVLVGTVLESTIILFEIPTGVVADAYSRRLSTILGRLFFGLAFVLEGSVPAFAAILLAEVIRGIGETFLSGASLAWLAAEVGEARIASIFLRAAQVRRAAAVVGIAAGVALASVQLNLAVIVGGCLSICLAGFLALSMSETGFHPAVRASQAPTAAIRHIVDASVRGLRSNPLLLVFVGIAAAAGASSEGFDRLWEAHLLTSFSFPAVGSLQPVRPVRGSQCRRSATWDRDHSGCRANGLERRSARCSSAAGAAPGVTQWPMIKVPSGQSDVRGEYRKRSARIRSTVSAMHQASGIIVSFVKFSGSHSQHHPRIASALNSAAWGRVVWRRSVSFSETSNQYQSVCPRWSAPSASSIFGIPRCEQDPLQDDVAPIVERLPNRVRNQSYVAAIGNVVLAQDDTPQVVLFDPCHAAAQSRTQGPCDRALAGTGIATQHNQSSIPGSNPAHVASLSTR